MHEPTHLFLRLHINLFIPCFQLNTTSFNNLTPLTPVICFGNIPEVSDIRFEVTMLNPLCLKSKDFIFLPSIKSSFLHETSIMKDHGTMIRAIPSDILNDVQRERGSLVSSSHNSIKSFLYETIGSIVSPCKLMPHRIKISKTILIQTISKSAYIIEITR